MIPALVSLKNLIKTKSYHIDYPIFRLHYQATVCALLAFCLILTAKILFGDTIDCSSRTMNRDAYFDNMCFSRGTYTNYALDYDSLVRSALEHESALRATNLSLTSGVTELKQITESLRNITNQAPISQDPPEQEKNVVDRFLEWCGIRIDKVIETLDGKPPEDLPVALAYNSTMRNITNHTYVPNSFPYQVLANTQVGNYIADQFRAVHKIVKSNQIPYSTDIEYLYSGILVPRETKELYSITFWHKYYQYITIILFLQAVLFYLPHYLWKNWENGIVSSICKRLHDNRISPTEYIESNYHMIDYLQNCFTLYRSLVYKYYLCHIFLLVNLIAQIILLNSVFNNQFITYGFDVFQYLFIDYDIYGLRGVSATAAELNNPMDFVFPKVTLCNYEVLSQSGLTSDKHNFLCVLPLNILHDKFFLALWCWFLILALLTILQIIFDSLYIAIPQIRKSLFKRRFGPYLSEDNRHSSSLSELFILDLIGTNSDKFAFAALLRKLNKEDSDSCPMENQSLV